MNKRQILASLNKIADQLDNNNLFKEATTLTNVMKRISEQFYSDPSNEDILRYLRNQLLGDAQTLNRDPKKDYGRDEDNLITTMRISISYWKDKFKGDPSFFDQEAEKYYQEALNSRILHNRDVNIKDERFFSPLVFGEYFYENMPLAKAIDIQLKWMLNRSMRIGSTPEELNEQIDMFERNLLDGVLKDSIEENQKNAIINYIETFRPKISQTEE
jgi:hypothetical protein